MIAPGTGAFVFKEYKQAERWVFERNPNYWDNELPYVERIEMPHVPAWTDRGTAILTDQADVSWNVSAETFADVRSAVPRIKVETQNKRVGSIMLQRSLRKLNVLSTNFLL